VPPIAEFYSEGTADMSGDARLIDLVPDPSCAVVCGDRLALSLDRQ
jgi:hypothetical protein